MTAEQMKRLTLEQLQELHQHPERIPSQICWLLETLTSDNEELRAWATDCIQELPALDDPSAAEVAAYCQHKNQFVANRACLTLEKATNLPQFQDSLAQALVSHASIGVRQSAAATLGALTTANPATRKALTAAAESSDARLQRLAKVALEKLT